MVYAPYLKRVIQSIEEASPGYDGHSISVYMKNFHLLLEDMVGICYLTLTKGFFPKVLKRVKAIPIYESNERFCAFMHAFYGILFSGSYFLSLKSIGCVPLSRAFRLFKIDIILLTQLISYYKCASHQDGGVICQLYIHRCLLLLHIQYHSISILCCIKVVSHSNKSRYLIMKLCKHLLANDVSIKSLCSSLDSVHLLCSLLEG